MVREAKTNSYVDSSGLEPIMPGVWKAAGARIIDRSGRKRLPIGRDGYVPAMRESVLVDKSMLIADVLDSGYAATLFCRPRRFGKTLNMTMLKAFLEAPEAGGLPKEEATSLFEGTELWGADGGYYRSYQGAYPVVSFSLRTAKGSTWEETLGALKNLILVEYQRHDYLLGSDSLPTGESTYLKKIMGGEASDGDYADSLIRLTRDLREYHSVPVVVLIDEYDAPVMAGHTRGYYDEVVTFLKRWLTGGIKDGGEALAFACLTGVQRISKESVFSDLNNLKVLTPLDKASSERFGFTDSEVQALSTYLGHADCMPEARAWYDGYRFGTSDVYNPWSVINYLDAGCIPGAYWGNTSGNGVVGELVAHADATTLSDIYTLLEPGGVTFARLDLGVVFPELGVRGNALWSMLYLAGYLTTDDIDDPSNDMRKRPLRIPNREVGRLFRNEVLKRFLDVAGGDSRLDHFHHALVSGDASALEEELGRITLRASSFDLTSELACHMLVMGLLFGVPGYRDPLSNREEGYGRYDIQLEPDSGQTGWRQTTPRPHITIEIKYLKSSDAPEDNRALMKQLHKLAQDALEQIREKGYDREVLAERTSGGHRRWGIAFSGKHVAAECESIA